MDEPFGALDAQTRAELEDFLLEIWEKFYQTILFVTHDIEEGIYLADRVLVLRHRPSVILEDISVDLPRPRNQLTTRESPPFLRLRARIHTMIIQREGGYEENLPSPAIIPMLILLLGIGDQMKIFIITWACFWPVLVNTIDGVRGVDRVLVDTARSFGSTRWELLRKTILPAASPGIVTGMRISLAISLILTVIAEMVAGRNGIGFYILDSERSFRVAEMYAGTFSLAAVGYLLNRAFVAADQKTMAWYKGLTSKEMR
jgi:ABC-type proline/glycine betaine transport system permease subunit